MKTFAIAVSALILGLFAFALIAQGPLYDKVIVDLPYAVTVSNTNLPPGRYEIRELPSASKSRVLQVFSDSGMKLEATVMTIPTLDNNTPSDTRVLLHHYGNDYYFDKIWIQGKNYGYEFVLPDSVKAREKERLAPYTVAATYQAGQTESGTTTSQSSSVSAAPSATTESQTSSATTESQTTVAQAEPAQPAPEPTPAPTPAPATTTHSDEGAASRSMPSTAANWLGLMLGGGLLSGAGLTLRRWIR